MNTITKIFLSLLLVCTTFIAQGQCLPEGITFTNQSQIDDFPRNHPDCTEIIGNVLIGGYLENLNGLSQITHIGGFLKINNTTLENMDGLENLQTVESLLMESNANLQNIEALSNLSSTNRIVLMNNHNLLTLSGLEGINILPQELSINQNSSLENLHGLENLVSIGKNCNIYLNPSL